MDDPYKMVRAIRIRLCITTGPVTIKLFLLGLMYLELPVVTYSAAY